MLNFDQNFPIFSYVIPLHKRKSKFVPAGFFLGFAKKFRLKCTQSLLMGFLHNNHCDFFNDFSTILNKLFQRFFQKISSLEHPENSSVIHPVILARIPLGMPTGITPGVHDEIPPGNLSGFFSDDFFKDLPDIFFPRIAFRISSKNPIRVLPKVLPVIPDRNP